MRITRLPANRNGLDLVVGDIHGYLDDFHALLRRAEFNPATDRVFCTGDLVDRGPDSLGCLALLGESWFHSVSGNHEQMFADNLRALLAMGPDEVRQFRRQLEISLDGGSNGAGWLVRAFLEKRAPLFWTRLLDQVLKLPNLLIVGSGEERFHVLHSDLFLGPTLLDDQAIDALETEIARGTFDKETLERMRHQISWSRTLAEMVSWGAEITPLQDGLSLTFCGHTIVQKPRLSLSHYHLDTGSGLQEHGRHQYGLTMVMLENGFPVATHTTKRERMIA